jgi:hypothetical protein
MGIYDYTLDRLIGQYGVPDFIKIDVEGYEKRVFMGLTQRVPVSRSNVCSLNSATTALLEWLAGTTLYSFDVVAK